MTPEINLPGLREETAGSSTKKATFMSVTVDHDHVPGIYKFI